MSAKGGKPPPQVLEGLVEQIHVIEHRGIGRDGLDVFTTRFGDLEYAERPTEVLLDPRDRERSLSEIVVDE